MSKLELVCYVMCILVGASDTIVHTWIHLECYQAFEVYSKAKDFILLVNLEGAFVEQKFSKKTWRKKPHLSFKSFSFLTFNFSPQSLIEEACNKIGCWEFGAKAWKTMFYIKAECIQWCIALLEVVTLTHKSLLWILRHCSTFFSLFLLYVSSCIL